MTKTFRGLKEPSRRIGLFTESLYSSKVMVQYGGNPKEMRRHLVRENMLHKKAGLEMPTYDSLGAYYDLGGRDYAIWISDRDKDRDIEIASAVAHESLHVTMCIMREIGCPNGKSSEEPYCYYLSWLTDRIFKMIKEIENDK